MKLKYYLERAKKGYCAQDLWDIKHWFLNLMPQMLKDFEKTRQGHPNGMTNEEWSETLSHMRHLFEEANPDTCGQINEYDDFDYKIEKRKLEDGNYTLDIIFPTQQDEEMYHKSVKRESEIRKYQNQCAQKGLKLFAQYIDHLWD